MPKTSHSLIAAAVLLLLLSAYGWMRHTRNPGAKDVVEKFYHMWTDSSIHPLVEFSYRGSPYLTREMQRRLDRQARSFETTGFDPVVCALQVPEDYDVSFTDGDSEHPTLAVDLPGDIRVTVTAAKQEDGTWLIDSVTCPDAAVDHTAAEALLKQQINVLSPAKAAAGATFLITEIAWNSDDSSIAYVTYTDGTIQYQAHAAMVMEMGKPVVKSFTIVPEA